jgi:hypothetical protein
MLRTGYGQIRQLASPEVSYTAAAIRRIQEGATFALNSWDQPASYRAGTAAGSWPGRRDQGLPLPARPC